MPILEKGKDKKNKCSREDPY